MRVAPANISRLGAIILVSWPDVDFDGSAGGEAAESCATNLHLKTVFVSGFFSASVLVLESRKLFARNMK